MKNLKIAICLSGQIRNWRGASENFHNIYLDEHEYIDFDIFFHTWNFNSVAEKSQDGSIKWTDKQLAQEEIYSVQNFYNPKKFLIEDKITPFWNPDLIMSDPGTISQLYSIHACQKLKTQYELDNDFVYDVVVRSRFDISYENSLFENFKRFSSNSIHVSYCNYDLSTGEKFGGFMNDFFWYSDSVTYDIFSEIYLNLDKINRNHFEDGKIWLEKILPYYALSNNINLVKIGNSMKIVRQNVHELKSGLESSYEIVK